MWELVDVLVVFLLAFLMSVCLFIGWWIVWGWRAAEARALRKKFVSLGAVEGKRLREIEDVVGTPKIWKTIGENRFSYHWQAQKYNVTLVFHGEICEGILNETSV
jgi:hypothetical protein